MGLHSKVDADDRQQCVAGHLLMTPTFSHYTQKYYTFKYNSEKI